MNLNVISVSLQNWKTEGFVFVMFMVSSFPTHDMDMCGVALHKCFAIYAEAPSMLILKTTWAHVLASHPVYPSGGLCRVKDFASLGFDITSHSQAGDVWQTSYMVCLSMFRVNPLRPFDAMWRQEWQLNKITAFCLP